MAFLLFRFTSNCGAKPNSNSNENASESQSKSSCGFGKGFPNTSSFSQPNTCQVHLEATYLPHLPIQPYHIASLPFPLVHGLF